jgi:uncharacterized membrane-anchored protein
MNISDLQTPRARQAIFALALLLILCAFNHAIYEKEDIIATGEVVLLELAPADPRSLIQGDYMRLRYAIGQDARAGLGTASLGGPVSVERPAPADLQEHGHLVITTDGHHVAKFARVDDGSPLAPGERRLRYHYRYGDARVVPDSFMFQEGQSKLYAQAKYGIFRFAPDGDSVLTGLADAAMRPIEPGPEQKAGIRW